MAIQKTRTRTRPSNFPHSPSSRAEERARAEVLARPRLFRSSPRSDGELFCIDPKAFDVEFSWGGIHPTYRTQDNIAVVTISGPLEHHKSWSWDSYERVLEDVAKAMTGQDMVDAHRAAHYSWWYGWEEGYGPLDLSECSPARAVVLNVDSPGGEAAGTMAAHRKLRALRRESRVPLFGFSNETACSAAYALISACDGVFLPDIARVGSIGVVATLFDRTKQNAQDGLLVELITSGAYKADGHADRPLTDGIRDRIQYQVDLLADVFWRTVAKARTRATGVQVTPKYVASLEAGVFIGKDAIEAGVADSVCDWDECLEIVRACLSESDSGEGEAQMPESGSDNAQLSPEG